MKFEKIYCLFLYMINIIFLISGEKILGFFLLSSNLDQIRMNFSIIFGLFIFKSCKSHTRPIIIMLTHIIVLFIEVN